MGDGFDALRSTGGAIKGRLMVTFVSQHGVLEAGIDHGGLVKEFLEEVARRPRQIYNALFLACSFVRL